MSGRIISSRSHLSLSSSGGGGGSATGRPAGPYYPSIPMVTICITTVSVYSLSTSILCSVCVCVCTPHCMYFQLLHYFHSIHTVNILCIQSMCESCLVFMLCTCVYLIVSSC